MQGYFWKNQFLLAPTYLSFIVPPTPFLLFYDFLRANSSYMTNFFTDIAKPTGIKEICNEQKKIIRKLLVCDFLKSIIMPEISGQLQFNVFTFINTRSQHRLIAYSLSFRRHSKTYQIYFIKTQVKSTIHNDKVRRNLC